MQEKKPFIDHYGVCSMWEVKGNVTRRKISYHFLFVIWKKEKKKISLSLQIIDLKMLVQ